MEDKLAVLKAQIEQQKQIRAEKYNWSKLGGLTTH